MRRAAARIPVSASISRSSEPLVLSLFSLRRRLRRSARSDTGSTRPIGPVTKVSACSPSSPSAAAASTVSSARTAGWSAGAVASAGVRTGTPAAASARGSTAAARGSDRTITAICDHGTPSTRCARRSVSAISAASACAGLREPHRHRSRLVPGAFDDARRRTAGQAAGDSTDRPGDRRCAAVRPRQGDDVVAFQQRGLRRRGTRTPSGSGHPRRP